MTDDEIDDQLAALAAATNAIVPRPGFHARVGGAIAGSWIDDMLRAARFFMPVAAVVAGLAILWAFSSRRAADDLAIREAVTPIDELPEVEW